MDNHTVLLAVLFATHRSIKDRPHREVPCRLWHVTPKSVNKLIYLGIDYFELFYSFSPINQKPINKTKISKADVILVKIMYWLLAPFLCKYIALTEEKLMNF